ncbi:MAG TPA: malectin domain-containing carbohydrate-binding protein, partial [Prolixibacteraceae bacterium]|nr:malectin domain-containing carbohydrate-binding protein [Prolixibacteraceae bacterium]
MKQIKPHVFNYAVFIIGFLIFLPGINHAQSYSAWYNNAQERIDTLRKGDFGIQIIDAEGQPYSGDVTVSMQKHEYPFGIAFDFYEGTVSMGNSYNTSSTVQASTDAEIYKTERWNDYLSYVLPVETGNEYKLTLKFAEIFHDGANARLFDVEVEGDLF